jgi:hypothetical protein
MLAVGYPQRKAEAVAALALAAFVSAGAARER